MRNLLIILLFIISFINIIGQRGESITGIITDSSSKAKMEYVTISLYKTSDSSLVTGTITDVNGKFHLKNISPNKYFLQLSFVGYANKNIGIDLEKNKSSIDLGHIMLSNNLVMKEVVIKSDIPLVKYEIDKKVVDVANMNTTIGQTAAEVLENIPSIQTDIEGNITIRGSQGFTLLINDIPTAMDPNDALKAIPASTIKNIEIITNPSARMQAEGSAGIINIITKRNLFEGISVLANLNAGNFERYGGEVNLNYNNKSHHFNFNISSNNRNHFRERHEERISSFDTDTSTIISNGIHNWGMRSFRAGGEWTYTPNKKHSFSVSSRIGKTYMFPFDDIFYYEYNNDELTTSYFNKDYSDIWIRTLSNSISYRYFIDTNRKEYFSFSAIYNRRSVDEYVYSDFYNSNNMKFGGNSGEEFGPSNLYRFNIDLIRLIKSNIKFETGVQIQFGDSRDARQNFQFDSVNQIDTLLEAFSTNVNYSRNVHGAYVMLGGKWKKLGYQFGLRSEYTYREIEASNIDISIQNIDRLDFFPSAHLSYNLSESQQLLVSFSRRIERPVSYYFEPFLSFQSIYSYKTGNPSLLPEFVNSFEAGWIKTLKKKGSVSIELYSKALSNLIRQTPTVYETNIILTFPENVGNSSSNGLEVNFIYAINKFWTTNLGGNIYYYYIKTTIDNLEQTNESTNWTLRFRNTLTFLKNWKFQIMANYNSKTVTALGEEADNYGLDLSLNKSFLDKKITFTAQARNILSSRRNIHTRDLNGVKIYNYRRPFAPIFMGTISISLNDYKKRYEKNLELDNF